MLDDGFPIWKSTVMDTPLKVWRTGAEKSAAEAAASVGVTLSMWSRWETGMRPVPPARVLTIEAATGISRHDLRPDIYGPASSEQAA